MIILCDMDSIILSGKVNTSAKTQIEKLKETDSLTIISNSNSIVVNNELLSTFIACKAKIEITACDISSPELYLKLGMMLGSIGARESIKIIIKSDKGAELKNTFKKYPNVSFGWDAKKETAKAGRKPKAAEKVTEKVIDDAPAKKTTRKKAALEAVATKEVIAEDASPKKARKPRTPKSEVAKADSKPVNETKSSSRKAEVVGGVPNDAMIKKYVGSISKADCDKVRTIVEATKEGLEVSFLCKIHLPILTSNDPDIVDKVKNLCDSIK